jgi:hypothetical protein
VQNLVKKSDEENLVEEIIRNGDEKSIIYLGFISGNKNHP